MTGIVKETKYKYEVLMIYNEKDLEFVENSHIGSLKQRYLLCLILILSFLFNFQSVCVTSDELPAGGSKPEGMTELIKKSRRVVAIISQYFISDPWCLLQFTLVMAEKLRDPSTKLLGLCFYFTILNI